MGGCEWQQVGNVHYLHYTNKKTQCACSTCFTNHGLLLKKLPLFNGIVQLCIGVADLLLHHKELETLRQTLLVSVPVVRAKHNQLIHTINQV